MNNQIYEMQETKKFEKPLIPDDVYQGTLIKTEEFPGKQANNEITKVRCIWKVNHQNKDIEFARTGNKVFSTESKLGKDFQALGIKIGMKFQPEMLYGKQARLVIKQEEIKNTDGTTRKQSVIKEVWPIKSELVK